MKVTNKTQTRKKDLPSSVAYKISETSKGIANRIPERVSIEVMKISMVEGSVGEDHRVLIGPFGGVTPSCTSLVPEMISWRKSDDPASEKNPQYC